MNQGVTTVSKLAGANGGAVPSSEHGSKQACGPSAPDGAVSVQARETSSASITFSDASVKRMLSPRTTRSPTTSR